MRVFVPWIAMCMAASANEPVRSGNVTAEFIVESHTYETGKPLKAGFVLDPDSGWHTYWINPGEGGMPMSVKWDLPEGWKAGELEWPVPERFMTGDLPGFGYERKFLIHVTLTPPPAASGEVTIGAQLNWLTCNDGACVPGEADLSLMLKPGKMSPSSHSTFISKLYGLIPSTLADAVLDVKREGSHLDLLLKLPEKWDGAALGVFPATRNVIDPGAPIHFERKGDRWHARVAVSEYLEGEPETLELVFRDSEHGSAKVAWRPDSKKKNHLKE